MDINATLIGQTIAMVVFVWFCMKFIWPPIMTAIEERQAEIADVLAAAVPENVAGDLALTFFLGSISQSARHALLVRLGAGRLLFGSTRTCLVALGCNYLVVAMIRQEGLAQHELVINKPFAFCDADEGVLGVDGETRRSKSCEL